MPERRRAPSRSRRIDLRRASPSWPAHDEPRLAAAGRRRPRAGGADPGSADGRAPAAAAPRWSSRARAGHRRGDAVPGRHGRRDADPQQHRRQRLHHRPPRGPDQSCSTDSATQSRRLESEIADLEQTSSELQSGADTQRVAREEAAAARRRPVRSWPGRCRRAGRASGCGSPTRRTRSTADVLLDAVEEMRDAGAEVIEVNDTVRVVGVHLVRHRRRAGW